MSTFELAWTDPPELGFPNLPPTLARVRHLNLCHDWMPLVSFAPAFCGYPLQNATTKIEI
jgi:hypothetical protein